MLIVSVDVEVVGIYGRDDGRVWMELEERTVKFVRFGDYRVGVGQQQIAVIVL